MRRGLVLNTLALGVMLLCTGARAQDEGRPPEGFIGPQPAPIIAEAPSPGGVAAQPAEAEAADATGTDHKTPAESVAAPVESMPLGGSGQTAFRARAGGADQSDPPPTSLRAGEGWWRTAGALAVILVLIFAVAAGVRKWGGAAGGLMHQMGAGGRAPSGVLSVLGRYPVGRGQTLVLLKLDRRVLLVCQQAGARGGGMRTLCELTDPEEVAAVVMHAAEAEGRSLSAKFREMVSGFERAHDETGVTVPAIEVPERRAMPAMVGSFGPDAADRLHSRLDSLRQAGWGGSA